MKKMIGLMGLAGVTLLVSGLACSASHEDDSTLEQAVSTSSASASASGSCSSSASGTSAGLAKPPVICTGACETNNDGSCKNPGKSCETQDGKTTKTCQTETDVYTDKPVCKCK